MVWKLSESSDEYKSRRRRQMQLFFGAAAVTILSSRFAYRATLARQFIPTMFQGNHHPPTSYNFTADAAVAVGTGTLLCLLVSAMMFSGIGWCIDVSEFREFGWRMKRWMGGEEKQRQLSAVPLDEESKVIQDGLNDLLEGKYDEIEE